MQVVCPACSRQLAVPEVMAGQAVQCPHCAQLLQLAPLGPMPAASFVAPATDPAVFERLARSRGKGGGVMRGVTMAVVAVAAFAVLVAAGVYAARRQTTPPVPTTPEQVAQLKAREYVSERLHLKGGARFAERGDIVRKLPGGKYVVSSYVDVPSRVTDVALRQKWVADVVQAKDQWRLDRLEVDGQVLVTRGGEVPSKDDSLPPSDDNNRDWRPDEPRESPANRGPDKTLAWAMQQLSAEIADSAKQRPTLVAWLLDRSASARLLVQEAARNLDRALLQLKPAAEDGKPAALQMTVASYAQDVKFLVESPSLNAEKIRQAFDSPGSDDSGRENTFAALLAVAEKCQNFRAQGGYVLLALVSDETGDDESRLEETLSFVRQRAMPVYVLGVPAPFGRVVAERQKQAETRMEGKKSISLVRQGPESRNVETIDLTFPDAGRGIDAAEQLGSGFGPFCLTRLCVESGGTYFPCHDFGVASGVRYNTIGWGGQAKSSPVFDAGIAKKYAPEYVADEEYQQILASNKACAALVEAGKLPRIEALSNVQTSFPKRDEAAFKRALDAAQREAAKFEPKIQVLYDTLKRGEADRSKMTQPRWQAGYDLAMGRCLAAKVRGDGYNAMLAKLKAGANFTKPGSSVWTLEAADTIAAGSAYEKMIEQARTYLNRVVKDHPGTPWALLAERELQSKMGWEWTEG